MTPSRRLTLPALLLALLTLGGCATQAPQPLYGWESYEKQIDQHFRQDKTGPDVQVRQLEDDRRKIEAAGQALPPGYLAHMGFLYGKQGDGQRFAEHLQAEKARFPEAGTFVDFLLRNFKKP